MAPNRLRTGSIIGLILLGLTLPGLSPLRRILPDAKAHAQVQLFYVEVDGSDENGDGSFARPWASIGHAVSQVPDVPNVVILVGEGRFEAPERIDRRFDGLLSIRAGTPYRAILETSLLSLDLSGEGIEILGFLITRGHAENEPVGFQLVSLRGRRLRLANCIISGRPAVLVSITDSASDISLQGNLFYHPGDPAASGGSHLTVTSGERIHVKQNIFFNDRPFAPNVPSANLTLAAITDPIRDAKIEGNIFLGGPGHAERSFLEIHSGAADILVEDVMVENNLLLGLGDVPALAALRVIGARGLTFRANTVTYSPESSALLLVLEQPENVPLSADLVFHNNILSDPSGRSEHFEKLPGLGPEPAGFAARNNLYYNGGQPIPDEGSIGPSGDKAAVIGDPLLPDDKDLILPVWQPENGRFAGGAGSIGEVFARLSLLGRTAEGSPAIDRADGDFMPILDITGRPRGVPDIGALERRPLVPTLPSTLTPPPATATPIRAPSATPDPATRAFLPSLAR